MILQRNLEKQSGHPLESELLLRNKPFIKVTGFAEEFVEPDTVEFYVKISCEKPELSDCVASVRKREEYVRSLLKKNHVGLNGLTETERVLKIASNNCLLDSEEEVPCVRHDRPVHDAEKTIQYRVTKEIRVQISSLTLYHHISFMCCEKLDFRVTVSEPMVSVSREAIERAEYRAVNQATENARRKALSSLQHSAKTIASHTLGPLICIIEDSITISSPAEQGQKLSLTTIDGRSSGKLISIKLICYYGFNQAEGS